MNNFGDGIGRTDPDRLGQEATKTTTSERGKALAIRARRLPIGARYQPRP